MVRHKDRQMPSVIDLLPPVSLLGNRYKRGQKTEAHPGVEVVEREPRAGGNSASGSTGP
jgi:hypothetical protein